MDDKELELLVNNAYIDLSKPPIKMPVYMSIRKSATENRIVELMTSQNFSAVKGKAKSKKTFFMSLLAGCMVANNSISNTLYCTIPENRRGVIYIDTEQSKFHTWRVGDRIKRIASIDNGFISQFSFRGQKAEIIMQSIKFILNCIPSSILIIDQIGDLVNSVNNEIEAKEVVRELELLTTQYNLHCSVVIHENPSKTDSKPTGWIGTQILKKAETIITVEKDNINKRIAKISGTETRGEDFEDFVIEINQDGIPIIKTDYEPLNDVI